ncbi:protein yellow [Papilio machaon]|uniref:protein yellow n=1 Tax=Papilio machaon TaxID=76193 RepID=UPI001E662DCD|nr:protein yellow [Papilio machaon]
MVHINDLALLFIFIIICFVKNSICLLPPEFEWKVIDFAWQPGHKEFAIASNAYIPKNNLPTGIARWRDKLFITIPRWKRGVPASLNYVFLNGSHQQPLIPYPTWADAFVPDGAKSVSTASTVVSAFRVHVDKCDRLWVVDNGATNICENVRQIAPPAIVVFDLKRDSLKYKHFFSDAVLRDSTVFSSIAVDIVDNDCHNTFAYVADMGAGALVVFDLQHDTSWRLEHMHFQFQQNASEYHVGGIDFFWHDGVSSLALSQTASDGYRDLYCYPTSSTKMLKISTKLLRNPHFTPQDVKHGVEVVGEKGPQSQSTACDYDPKNNVLYYTELSKNGVGCWNLDRPFNSENTQLLISDCVALEYPNDIKMDFDGNVWILSDRQARFLYDKMDFTQINFRVLCAESTALIQGTRCQLSMIERAIAYIKK